MLPAVFAGLHPRYGSPVEVVAVLTGSTVVAPFFGRPALVWLDVAGSLATVVADLLVTAAFLIIRRRRPELPRPYRVPASALVGWPAIVTSAWRKTRKLLILQGVSRLSSGEDRPGVVFLRGISPGSTHFGTIFATLTP